MGWDRYGLGVIIGASVANGEADSGTAEASAADTSTQLSALDVLAALGVPEFMRRRAPRPLPPARVTVVIPAHNEASSIGNTLASLHKQTLVPHDVLVVCDNCSDATQEIATGHGARTFVTEGNTARKVGALNQALAELLPVLSGNQLVLVMDADSQLNEGWLESAAAAVRNDTGIGAVCGVYFGEPGCGILGQLQRNEYVRYARSVYRRRQTPVLSGTGTLFRVSALREIARERGRRLPGVHGEYYNTHGITEDNEITLALKSLGFRCLPGPRCETMTEVMPTIRHLFSQRLRWQTGTLLDLRLYGFNSVTAGYWLRQLAMYASIGASIACWVIIGWSMASKPSIDLTWTAAILAISLIERLWTVRKGGAAALGLTVVMLPEFAFDIFRMVVFVQAFSAAIRRRDVGWNHVAK